MSLSGPMNYPVHFFVCTSREGSGQTVQMCSPEPGLVAYEIKTKILYAGTSLVICILRKTIEGYLDSVPSLTSFTNYACIS